MIYEMLVGEGACADVAQQITWPVGVYAQVATTAKKAWRKLPDMGRKTEDLSKVRQGPDELYQDFVSCLLQAVGRLMGDGEASTMLVKQLAL